MRLMDLFSSRAATSLGLWISQHAPRSVAMSLASLVATVISSLRPAGYWTVRANLRHVLGPDTPDEVLHAKAREVFRCAGQSNYDYFRAVGRPIEELDRLVDIPDEVFEHIASSARDGRGLLVLGTHHSSFDLAGLAIAARGDPIQVLSLADPGAGSQLLNRLRAVSRVEVTPISPESLRAALRRLSTGGTVITGIDRPNPGDCQPVELLGCPAELPVGPVRLALLADARVLLVSCYYGTDGTYHLMLSGPLEMVRAGDRQRDLQVNIEATLALVEKHICAYPEQWLMFYPVWAGPCVPEAAAACPEG